MPSDYGLTSAGYVAPRAADFLELIRADIESELESRGLSTDIDWDRDVMWGITSTVTARRLGLLGQLTQSLVDGYDINNATGALLDSIGGIRGLARLPAEYTTVVLTLGNTTGTAQSLLANQAQAEGGGTNDRQKWVLVEDATIPAGGTVDATFRSAEKGEVEASIGEIDTIVTSAAGWTSVTNAAVPSPGQDIETDTAYRIRLQSNLVPSLGQNGNSLRASLVKLEGVTSAGVIDNPTASTTVVDTVTLAPHSKAVFVWPDTLTADQIEQVAQTIYNQTDFGIYTNGTDNVRTITGADGYDKEVRFDWANEVVVTWSAALTLDPDYVLSDVSDQVKANVAAYFNNLAVGDDVLLLRVQATIAAVDGVIGITTLLLDGGASDKTITAAQIATEGAGTVT